MKSLDEIVLKTILFVIVGIFVVNNTFSQAKFGIKAGINFASLSETEGSHVRLLKKDGMATGFHVGVFTNVRLIDVINFQPELLFSMQGGYQKEYQHETLDRNFKHIPESFRSYLFQLGYIQLPLLFEIKPFANLGFLVGAQLGLNVSRKVTVTDSSGFSSTSSGSEFYMYYPYDREGFKKLDASLIYGLQYTFKDKITIGARYNLGLSNSLNHSFKQLSAKGWKSSVIQAGLGFSF